MRTMEAKYEILTPINGMEILKQIERIARTCYKSDKRITDDSAIDFVKGLVERGHWAMIEHGGVISVKFYVDRGVTHEMVRHRIASFAQESTRYCNYAHDRFENQITFIDIQNGIRLDTKMRELTASQIELIVSTWYEAIKSAESFYLELIRLGATPQIARSVLPNAVKSEIIITANIREWATSILKLRTEITAHPQMREVMIPLHQDFKSQIPVIFDGIQ